MLGTSQLPWPIRLPLQLFRGPAAKQLDEDEALIDLQVGRTVQYGVPRLFRAELWRGVLLQRRGAGTAAAKQYTKLLLKPIQPETAADIEKDVGRTFPNLRRFSTPEGRRSLEMVLRAYAASDPEVGYCQGMNFLAGVLLAWLPADADAFGGLVVLMQERELRQLYTTDLAMLQVRLWQIGKLMPPQLAHHMEMHGALPVLYASSWLLTAFASDFPLSFASRVMDVILTDNYTAAMMKVVLGILRHCEAALLAMTDMEQMVDYLKMEVPCLPRETLHELLTDALKAPWTPRQAAILEQVSGAETVVDAVRRVDRMSSGEEPTLAETPSLPIAPTAYHLTALPPPAVSPLASPSRGGAAWRNRLAGLPHTPPAYSNLRSAGAAPLRATTSDRSLQGGAGAASHQHYSSSPVRATRSDKTLGGRGSTTAPPADSDHGAGRRPARSSTLPGAPLHVLDLLEWGPSAPRSASDNAEWRASPSPKALQNVGSAHGSEDDWLPFRSSETGEQPSSPQGADQPAERMPRLPDEYLHETWSSESFGGFVGPSDPPRRNASGSRLATSASATSDADTVQPILATINTATSSAEEVQRKVATASETSPSPSSPTEPLQMQQPRRNSASSLSQTNPQGQQNQRQTAEAASRPSSVPHERGPTDPRLVASTSAPTPSSQYVGGMLERLMTTSRSQSGSSSPVRAMSGNSSGSSSMHGANAALPAFVNGLDGLAPTGLPANDKVAAQTTCQPPASSSKLEQLESGSVSGLDSALHGAQCESAEAPGVRPAPLGQRSVRTQYDLDQLQLEQLSRLDSMSDADAKSARQL